MFLKVFHLFLFSWTIMTKNVVERSRRLCVDAQYRASSFSSFTDDNYKYYRQRMKQNEIKFNDFEFFRINRFTWKNLAYHI